jgi:hypothetical protein
MRKGKGTGNEEQEEEERAPKAEMRCGENKTGAGAQEARMAIAKVKTAVFPSPQIYKPRACSPERTSRAH